MPPSYNDMVPLNNILYAADLPINHESKSRAALVLLPCLANCTMHSNKQPCNSPCRPLLQSMHAAEDLLGALLAPRMSNKLVD